MPVLKTKINGQWTEVYGAPSEAEKNVQVNWTETDATSDAYIQNKPTLGAIATKDAVAKTDLASDVQTSLGKADTALQPADIESKANINSPVFTGTPKTSANTNYAVAQLRNIICSTNEPTDSDGNNGDIWVVYEV